MAIAIRDLIDLRSCSGHCVGAVLRTAGIGDVARLRSSLALRNRVVFMLRWSRGISEAESGGLNMMVRDNLYLGVAADALMPSLGGAHAPAKAPTPPVVTIGATDIRAALTGPNG